MHFDLITTDFDAEVGRLTGLGATKLNEINAGCHWATLADPEGNEFDLIAGEMIYSKGLSDRRPSVSAGRFAGGVVVPDRGGQREDALHDAEDDTRVCALGAVEVKLSLEGLVDRFDDLSQRLEQGCARPFPFTFTGRPQQLDSMLGQFAFETTAEVVLVADESLSGALSQKLAFGCQEVKEGLAFVGLGPGQGEGDGRP